MGITKHAYKIRMNEIAIKPQKSIRQSDNESIQLASDSIGGPLHSLYVNDVSLVVGKLDDDDDDDDNDAIVVVAVVALVVVVVVVSVAVVDVEDDI